MNLSIALPLGYEQLDAVAQSPGYWTILSTAFGDRLTLFASQENFWQIFESIYGGDYDSSWVESLRSQWKNGDFSQLPSIQVLDREILGNALGGYAQSTNTIYLSGALADVTSEQIIAVILEEIGHFVDAQVNATDTPGDEGE